MGDDHVEGAKNEIKGEVKEEWGKATGDRSTEISGKADQVQGNMQQKIGDLKDEVREDQTR